MDEQSVARTALPDTTREDRETRPCRSCRGSGQVVEEAEYDATTGRLMQVIGDCPVCEGAGEVSVYLYPKRRTERRA